MIDRPIGISIDAPQFVKDEIDRRNKEWMEAHGLDHLPKTWNADSRDGTIKGSESNCVLVALSDSGFFNGKVWLSVVADAPGSTLKEFALNHPTGSFLVSYEYPEQRDMYPFAFGGHGHYSAMVDHILYNASGSAADSKVSFALEVLHEEDLEARGIKPEELQKVSVADGTPIETLASL